jgi:hypothetical protein
MASMMLAKAGGVETGTTHEGRLVGAVVSCARDALEHLLEGFMAGRARI